ncbi:hypothetical protein [Nonomuraea recticatena]
MPSTPRTGSALLLEDLADGGVALVETAALLCSDLFQHFGAVE